MLFGSTSRNITILTIFSMIVSCVGFFNPAMFTAGNIAIAVISFYILNICGIWMMHHRYFSHRSFEFQNSTVKWIFTVISILAGRGSPLGWVYLHRKHHRYSDTAKDPHSPKFLGYKLFGFGHMKSQEEEKMDVFSVKDLMTKEQLFIHKWYMAIMSVFIISFMLINLELFYFVWALPALVIQLSQHNFNYFGHMFGYRNSETKDDSRNNAYLFPFLLGEAWHNNHHADPKNYTTKKQNFEYDPLATFIEVVKK